jgi:hypothetical protein
MPISDYTHYENYFKMSYQIFPGIIAEHKAAVIKNPKLNISTIEMFVCRAFNTTHLQMKENNKVRRRELTKARQMIFYLAKKWTPKSLALIGLYYHKDHSTVLHACKVITNIIETKDKDFYPILLLVEYNLKNYLNEQQSSTRNQQPATSNTPVKIRKPFTPHHLVRRTATKRHPQHFPGNMFQMHPAYQRACKKS